MNYACKNKNNTFNYLPKYSCSRCTNRPSRSWKPVASGWLVFCECTMYFDFICKIWINWSYSLNQYHLGYSMTILSHDISQESKSKNDGYKGKYPRFLVFLSETGLMFCSFSPRKSKLTGAEDAKEKTLYFFGTAIHHFWFNLFYL